MLELISSRKITLFHEPRPKDSVSRKRYRGQYIVDWGQTCYRYTDQCQIGSMERYPLREKIMCLTKILFMAAVMVACATSQQFNKIRNAL